MRGEQTGDTMHMVGPSDSKTTEILSQNGDGILIITNPYRQEALMT